MILSRNLPAFQTSPQRQPRGLPQVLPLGLSQSSRDKAAWPLPPGAWFSVSSQRQPATGSTRTRNSQASATGRTLFGVFHLSSSHLSRMTCAKIPPESWASQCVKKAPHGAELCNHNKKKKRERNQSLRKPGWDLNLPGPGHMPRLLLLVWGPFSPRIVLSSKSLTLWGCGCQRGWTQSSAARRPGQQCSWRVTSLTHTDTPKHVLPHWPQPHQKTQGFPGPPTPSPLSCHV